ncbi:MAG TPA: sigma-54 dependent transcriptional regulator [Ktedonobacterales bacterium]|nr:sigma-54 dependent transcriptional regulator [Ktedonobacterales bacterium]
MAEARKSSDTKTSTSGARVLIADDDAALREVLSQVLDEEGYQLDEAANGQEVLEKVATSNKIRPDIVLLDIGMPDTDGIQVLQTILEQGIDIPVIIITGRGAGSLVVKAMQIGAADYIRKPFADLDDIVHAVRRVLTYEKLKQEVLASKSPMAHPDPTERIVGSSPEMIAIFKTIGRVARTQATVLVTGETGTGKELMAEAIHSASDRRSGPLIKVNCAALPETLLESELFGHEKGSFTGALAQHKGRFEAANRGTIFLDEVGEMSLATQKKLLRVLQEREFERVGGTAPVKVDVRVIAATNRTLRDEVLEGRFREDLFYRLNVIEVHMPPLRDRKEDIPALVSHFLDKHRYSGVAIPAHISEEAVAQLMVHEWPGNVRELENIIQRAVVLSRGDLITPEHIVFQSEMSRYILDVDQKVRAGTPLDDMLAEVRRQAITTAIRLNEPNRQKAADQLGISLKQLEEMAAELEMPIA